MLTWAHCHPCLLMGADHHSWALVFNLGGHLLWVVHIVHGWEGDVHGCQDLCGHWSRWWWSSSFGSGIIVCKLGGHHLWVDG